MKSNKENFLKIGEYQFKNLISNPILFWLIDLRAENKNPTLQKAQSVDVAHVQDFIDKQNAQKDAAIVIICEDGKKSITAAQGLATNGFINVVVLENGTRSLTS